MSAQEQHYMGNWERFAYVLQQEVLPRHWQTTSKLSHWAATLTIQRPLSLAANPIRAYFLLRRWQREGIVEGRRIGWHWEWRRRGDDRGE